MCTAEHQAARKDSGFELELAHRPILAANINYLWFGNLLFLCAIPDTDKLQLPTITNAEWKSLAYSGSLIFYSDLPVRNPVQTASKLEVFMADGAHLDSEGNFLQHVLARTTDSLGFCLHSPG